MNSKKINYQIVQPLVTIGVASYNNARFILETLDSIAHQTYKNIEIIINDDASKDNSVEVIENWVELHPELDIIFLKSEQNQGICKALNKILRICKGKYISLIGSDDRYLPEFIEKRVSLLETSDNDTGLCYSLTYVIDTDGVRTKIDERPTPSGFLFEYLAEVRHSLCKPFTCLYKADCFKHVGLYDENLFYEDLDWFFRVSKAFKIEYFPELDTEFRVVPGSLGSKLKSEVGLKAQFEIIKKNLGVSSTADTSFKIKIKRLALATYKSNYKSLSRKMYMFYINYYHDYGIFHLFLLTFVSPVLLSKIKRIFFK